MRHELDGRPTGRDSLEAASGLARVDHTANRIGASRESSYSRANEHLINGNSLGPRMFFAVTDRRKVIGAFFRRFNALLRLRKTSASMNSIAPDEGANFKD